jgi:hypothetical protein
MDRVQAMYGKSFASMFTGSMFGLPTVVHAVWSYVIANQRPDKGTDYFTVELNPVLLSAMFRGETPETITGAIVVLTSPDPGSRSEKEGGRRLIALPKINQIGPALYWVVNGKEYRNIQNEEQRREYERVAKARQRRRKRGAPQA